MRENCPLCGSAVKKTKSFFYCPECAWYEPLEAKQSKKAQQEIKKEKKPKKEEQLIPKSVKVPENDQLKPEELPESVHITDEEIDSVLSNLYLTLIESLGDDILEFEDLSSSNALKVATWIKNNIGRFILRRMSKEVEKETVARIFINLNEKKDTLKLLSPERVEVESKPKVEEKPQQKVEQVEPKDTSLLARVKLSGEELHKSIPIFIKIIKTQLGADAFDFDTIIDTKAKYLAKWIFDNLEATINRELDINTKKELSTRIFIEVCREIKGNEWLNKF